MKKKDQKQRKKVKRRRELEDIQKIPQIVEERVQMTQKVMMIPVKIKRKNLR